MALVASIESNASQVALQLVRGGGAIAGLLRTEVMATAEAAGALLEPAVRDRTPVDTGALQRSTQNDVLPGPGNSAILQVSQNAENSRGQTYVGWLVQGHRIVTRSGVDTGRRTQPNNYPLLALEATRPAIDVLIANGGRKVAIGAMVVMRG